MKTKNENGIQHIAILMDGNRRWAKKNGLQAIKGHEYVVNQCIEPLIDRCIELGIPYITLWAFSTENWNRSPLEVQTLLSLFRTAFKKNAADLHKKGVRLNVIGDMSRFPADIRTQTDEWIKLSHENTKITATFALNYGGRDEIIRAVNKLPKGDVTEEMITESLDTAGMPDPEIIIRTGGEQRLSGFMLWQLEYSELFFSDVLMPDFTPAELDKVIEEFHKRNRRFGR